MKDIFSRFAPYIQNFIYSERWEELRDVQVEAGRVIFDTDDNLLLSSGTASGKTEAAFLPVLTELYNRPSSSVGVLYISPLKALINDQFKRLEYILRESCLPVCRWHGDASVTDKNKLVRNPQGILQITPESLESLLMRRRGDCIKLFSDLRFIIIDEVHYFMRDARGVQLLCLLERLQRLAGTEPRRIGLSATLGDLEKAKEWLSSGTKRACSAPVCRAGRQRIRLLIERFTVNQNGKKPRITPAEGSKDKEEEDEFLVKGQEADFYEYIYKMTLGKKTIIFANSREEIEYVIANLRQIAIKHGTPDVYRVHHGNISTALREQAEEEMRLSEEYLVTGATVTLELGIDIGSLDQVVQIGAPPDISSFAQRLGRCGRKGQIPQVLFAFSEDVQASASDALGTINWGFIRTIAIIELYTKARIIEPIEPGKHMYALMYHQTMSYLFSAGETPIRRLFDYIGSLSAFRHIPPSDYALLLKCMLASGQIQEMEDGGIIIGREGEKVVNNYNFTSVFIVPEYYLVKCESRAIGTVDTVYPAGTRFSLAGRTWEVCDINRSAKIIFVKAVPGVSTVDWDVRFSIQLHTLLVRKMREILLSDDSYAYLSPSCCERLAGIRESARNAGILENTVVNISDTKFAIFPWVGTRQLYTLHYLLLSMGFKSSIKRRTSVYIELTAPKATKEHIEGVIREIITSEPDLFSIPLPKGVQIEHKYNEHIPSSLLKKEFILDFLDFNGLRRDISLL